MTTKFPHNKRGKAAYLAYQSKVASLGHFSYQDMDGKIFTACEECEKDKTCKHHNGTGCMIGETRPEVLKDIEREG